MFLLPVLIYVYVYKLCPTCKELESNAKCGRFWVILPMWWIRMYATQNLTSCAFFTKCEILIRNTWRIGTNFARAVRNWYQFFTVWNLRIVKFAVLQPTRTTNRLVLTSKLTWVNLSAASKSPDSCTSSWAAENSGMDTVLDKQKISA